MSYDSRDIVFDYLRYKLLRRGVAWQAPPLRRPIGVQRRRNEALLPWRSERARAWHRGGEEEASPGEEAHCAVMATAAPVMSHPLLRLLLFVISPVCFLPLDPCLAPPPRLQVVLRSAGDELDRRSHGNLTAHASALLMRQDGRSAQRSLVAVREELFRDGVNWGRIMALMELVGALSAQVANTEGAWQVDDIARWMVESLDSPPIQGWIEDNGGWVGGCVLSFFTHKYKVRIRFRFS